MDPMTTFVPIILLIAVMYFLLIRPQKKREREINAMRGAIKDGDEIITIGGICGKVVKAKTETLVIQVGADKTKFEIMRWAVSKVVDASAAPARKPVAKIKEPEQEDEEAAADEVAEAVVEQKPQLPRRLKKSNAEKDAGLEE
ncbi:MAG: preprotein translocase subunit YajC [Clostridiales Family XIII bacterium]|jgi:preprotein translocase YajC subunit|nr:preprotein translocase subunit YajC [Clostridiales Family XIII bacterium]